MDDKLLNADGIDKRLLEHAIKYYGKNRFKRLYKSRLQKETARGLKGDIPNRVLRQLICMEMYYGPYKEDEPEDN